jgi:hypothetical protein
MLKEKKLTAVKLLLESGKIESVEDIFELIPKTNVYRKLGLGYIKFLEKLKDPGLFTINELSILSNILGVEYSRIHGLAKRDADQKEKEKKKVNKK